MPKWEEIDPKEAKKVLESPPLDLTLLKRSGRLLHLYLIFDLTDLT